MIASLVSLAVTVAALLLMLSLPLGDSHAGGALRRAAALARLPCAYGCPAVR